jgi:hypothetical protein
MKKEAMMLSKINTTSHSFDIFFLALKKLWYIVFKGKKLKRPVNLKKKVG